MRLRFAASRRRYALLCREDEYLRLIATNLMVFQAYGSKSEGV